MKTLLKAEIYTVKKVQSKNTAIGLPIYEDQKDRVGKNLNTVEKFKQGNIEFLKKCHLKKKAICHYSPLALS